jgi:YD repeat-containing protein
MPPRRWFADGGDVLPAARPYGRGPVRQAPFGRPGSAGPVRQARFGLLALDVPGWRVGPTMRLVEIPARLVATTALPFARRLLSHPEGRHRTPDGLLIAMRVEDRMRVYHVDRLLAGDSGPVADFPTPWASWSSHHGNTFLPDLSAAVFSEDDKVRAVDQSGRTRWEWSHSQHPWGQDERGAVVATSDGTQVWAVVPAVDAQGNEVQDLVVLAAGDGRLLGRTTLLNWRQPNPFPLAHADGRHVGVNFIEQDQSDMFWAVLEADGTVHAWQVPCEEESVIDVRADGRLVASHSGQGYFVAQRRFPDGDLVGETDNQEMRALLDGEGESDDDDDGYWRYQWEGLGGFVDDRTVLAALGGPDDVMSHWLLKSPADLDQKSTQLVLGRVRYEPEPCSMFYIRALGDGTWLSADEQSIQRWNLA